MVAGAVCGVLGVTGLMGFLFYFVSAAAGGALLMARTGGRPRSFFTSTSALFTHGFFQGLMSFVLGWTLMGNIVHVFA